MARPSGAESSSLVPSTGTSSLRSANQRANNRRLVIVLGVAGALTLALVLAVMWLASIAATIRTELEGAAKLMPQLKAAVVENQNDKAAAAYEVLRAHTTSAREASEDPVWAAASILPGIGVNFSAMSELARSADDVTNLGVAPLMDVFEALNWSALLPGGTEADLLQLQEAAPKVNAAAHTVRVSWDRLYAINSESLFEEVATPLNRAKQELADVTEVLNASASGAQLLPQMLGLDSPRSYLLMVQNNAEVRSSGGIPGALAILTVSKGKLTLGAQSSAAEIGAISPPVAVHKEQEQIFTTRLGKYMQDVNLTPDFPTAAASAQSMWEKRSGQRVDGVISVDPIALAHVLEVTGPVELKDPVLVALAGSELPTALSSSNVVPTLLSDVYAAIEQPASQDAYFAGVADAIFDTVSEGTGNTKGLLDALIRSTSEGRILLWSASENEQSIIAEYPVSGSIAGTSVAPAQFGVYFNDGTGAKMDYYVERTAQLIKECPRDGYEHVTVRITSTNTAPAEASALLPSYVTGGGRYGVPPGSVQTNIIAYGPAQALVEAAKLDGQRTQFAPYRHGNRPVGVLSIRLAPGESKTVEFAFTQIVQDTEPNLVVTPTVRDVKEAALPTASAPCI